MTLFALVVIVFTMADTFACTCELDLAAFQRFDITNTVFVCQLAVQYIAENFRIGVRMRGEAASGSDPVLVDDPQWAKAHVLRVVVA